MKQRDHSSNHLLEQASLRKTDMAQDLRHTENITEIITKVPAWILRWGITLFFVILIVAEVLLAVIRYPDTVRGTIKIESSAISKAVVTPISGMITKVLVKKGLIVKRGEPLVCLENSDGAGKSITLFAPQNGKVRFEAVVRPHCVLEANQEVFVVRSEPELFFGIMKVSPSNISRIKEGQQVLISLKNSTVANNEKLKGIISDVTDEPSKDGFFTVKICLNNAGLATPMEVKRLDVWRGRDCYC